MAEINVQRSSKPNWPLIVLALLIVALIGTFVMNSTTFGRYLYAIGSNPEAARLSGISINKHILGAFAFLSGGYILTRAAPVAASYS